MDAFPIGIFDSGAGGLSVLAECRRLLPHEDYIYLSDAAYAPYGNKTDEAIAARVFACSERLLSLGCKAIVVACNTATNVGIKMLRQRYHCPFVGLEPALKPANGAHLAGEVVLLCTEATARQKKFLKLYEKFGGQNIRIAPQKNLAALIESNLCDIEKIRTEVYRILAPFRSANGIILGCTHYLFIKDLITDFYGAQGTDIRLFDGNAGAAHRLKTLLKRGDLLSGKKTAGSIRLLFTAQERAL